MYEYERNKLVDNIERKGVKDEKVLNAMRKVERHRFVPDAVSYHAYKDVAMPIGHGQTISQPYTVAFMTEQLRVNQGDKVLEIGTGSGYQAAVLYEMGIKVYTIERHMDLYNRTLKLFDELGIRAAARCGDGTLGWNDYAPYDGIIVTAGAPKVSESLKKQCKPGGRIVIPVGDRKSQKLLVLEKIDDNEFRFEEIPNFAFVPLIGKQGWNEK